ncbi:MAG: hypothetical protein Q8867_04015, partial [Bacteroidota bacterium]|nr:hypothetical protein [Bacteroidota bacterium]
TSLVNVTFGSGNKPGEPGDNRMRPPTGGPGSNQMKPPQGDSLPPSILKGNPPKKQGKMMPRQRAFSFPGIITTEGFRDGFNSTWIPGKGKDDFSAFFAYDSTGALILEVRVPVNAFQIDPRNSDCVAMGFEITSMGGGMGQGGFGGPQGGGMQGPGGRQGGGHVEGGIQGGPGGSGMGGGDRMGGGSGMGEPGGGHSGGGFQEESKTYKIWHKFIFAPIP